MREAEEGEERDMDQFVVPLTYSLLDSCVCPDWGSNLEPWCIGATL